MTTTLAPPAATPVLRTRRGVAATSGAMVVLALLYADFMVPLLAAGLADAPMVSVADETRLNGHFVSVSLEVLPPGFVWIGFLLALATISLGPLVAAVGLAVGGWVAFAEGRAGHRLRALVSMLTCVGFTALLALALSPWGRTAKAWFFD